jgi:hypothetical protein
MRFVEVELEATMTVTLRNTVVMAIPDTLEDDDIEDFLSDHDEALVIFDHGVPHQTALTYALDGLLTPDAEGVDFDIEDRQNASVIEVRAADEGDRVTLTILPK